jgi:TPR repeat protein
VSSVAGRRAGRCAILLAPTALIAALVAACTEGPRFIAHAPLPPRAGAICPLGGCAHAAPALAGSSAASTSDVCAAPGACDVEPARVCDARTAPACTSRAFDLWTTGGAPMLARVAALFDRACALGDLQGCHFAGRLALEGHGVPRDAVRGRALLEKGCDGGIVISCDVLARYLAAHHDRGTQTADDDSDGDAGDHGERRFTRQAECLRGVANSCFYVGLYFERGANGFPKDYARGAASYARGCDLGEIVSCNNLGNDYYYGDGVPQDFAEAARYYGKACAGGEAVGCANVGFITEYGDGALRDMKHAMDLYMTGCSGGSTYACLHVAMMEEYKRGAPHDPAQAVTRWRRGCDAKDGKACAYLGVMHEDGKGTARDEREALSLMRLACKLGETRGCAWVREHGSL